MGPGLVPSGQRGQGGRKDLSPFLAFSSRGLQGPLPQPDPPLVPLGLFPGGGGGGRMRSSDWLNMGEDVLAFFE